MQIINFILILIIIILLLIVNNKIKRLKNEIKQLKNEKTKKEIKFSDLENLKEKLNKYWY